MSKKYETYATVKELIAEIKDAISKAEAAERHWIIAGEKLAELKTAGRSKDQPQIGRALEPTEHVTSAVGYVRLHGRNYQNWFSPKADVRARYDYLYRPEELEPWVVRIKEIAQDAEEAYVVANNHNLGKATVNALELEAFLSGGPVRVPPVLVEHYPDLQGIAKDSSGDLTTHG